MHDNKIILFEKKSERYEESASVLFEKLIDEGYKNVFYILDKNNKITLKAIDVESMSKRKEVYAFLKNEIYQTYHTEENVKKRSYQSDNTDKPGYRYEFKNKNNKKERCYFFFHSK